MHTEHAHMHTDAHHAHTHTHTHTRTLYSQPLSVQLVCILCYQASKSYVVCMCSFEHVFFLPATELLFKQGSIFMLILLLRRD